MPEKKIKNRKLVIIDDQLFNAVNGTGREPTDAEKLEYRFTLRTKKDREALTPLQNELDNKKWPYLYNITSHIKKGNFYDLTELIIYDLNLAVLEKKIFKRDTETEQKDIQQCAILIDIYSEKDKYPTGIDIAEGLDQTPFADRIAWLSVTGNLSSDLKPYPLIRKREIPPVKRKKNSKGERDTLFLWWGWLFDDFKIDDKTIQKQSGREVVKYLRECTVTTINNVSKVEKELYIKRGKGARKGGLAGNILEPILWRIAKPSTQKGKIVNAFLKIKGVRDEKKDETKGKAKGGAKSLRGEEKFNQFISSKNKAIKFPVLYCSKAEYYCMEKIEGKTLSDFIFERIGVKDIGSFLKEILKQISAYHKRQCEIKRETKKLKNTDTPSSDSLVLGYILKIKQNIWDWVQHNKYFLPLVNAKTLMINNIQYYNALYLCEILESTYFSRESTFFPRESKYLPDATVRLKAIDAAKKIKVHGDLLAQNIFVGDGDIENPDITIIDPKGDYRDYLVDFYKLFSSFSGQGHLEYLVQNPDSKLAHFSVNNDINPAACYYACSPSIEDAKGFKNCQLLILKYIQKQQKNIYLPFKIETNQNAWLERFLLGLASQYLCAPPLRDSDRFDEEMKFLYYRGVEILNEFFEMMSILTLSQKVVTTEVLKKLMESGYTL